MSDFLDFLVNSGNRPPQPSRKGRRPCPLNTVLRWRGMACPEGQNYVGKDRHSGVQQLSIKVDTAGLPAISKNDDFIRKSASKTRSSELFGIRMRDGIASRTETTLYTLTNLMHV